MSNFMTLLTALLGSAGGALLLNLRRLLAPRAAPGGAASDARERPHVERRRP